MIYFNKRPFSCHEYDVVAKVNTKIRKLKDVYNVFWEKDLLPDYFGWNLAAFNDSIYNWRYDGSKKAVICFSQKIELNKRDLANLLVIINDQVEYWRQAGCLLDVYFEDDKDGNIKKTINKVSPPLTKEEREEMAARTREHVRKFLEEEESSSGEKKNED